MEQKEKKQGVFSKLVKYVYADDHPQHKFYKGINEQAVEREKELNAERRELEAKETETHKE